MPAADACMPGALCTLLRIWLFAALIKQKILTVMATFDSKHSADHPGAVVAPPLLDQKPEYAAPHRAELCALHLLVNGWACELCFRP